MPVLEQLTTDPDEPLRQRAYQSPLRDERIAGILGAALGVLFSVAFLTGLYSHLQQHPVAWLPIPARPAGLYRITQSVHVATGIASMPVLLAKLWVVWPRFVSLPPVRGVRHLVERLGLLPLVAGAIFLEFSGIANIALWYPWHFGFPAAHFWMAWVTMGALLAHLGAKWAIARRALRRPARRPALGQADPLLGAVAETSHNGLTRRGFLWTAGAASATLTVVTVGETVRPLRRLSLLAPRDPDTGSQGKPVNRSAANAGVVVSAASSAFRLVVEGRGVVRPLSLTVADVLAVASRTATLPISCVEGWSYSAQWRGLAVRDLLSMAGAPHGATVRVESLEQNGPYRISFLDRGQAQDDDTLLATHLDGEPLSLDHGYPLRLIAPGRAGVLQTKWVNRLVVE